MQVSKDFSLFSLISASGSCYTARYVDLSICHKENVRDTQLAFASFVVTSKKKGIQIIKVVHRKKNETKVRFYQNHESFGKELTLRK